MDEESDEEGCSLYGGEAFGLKSDEDMRALGERVVRVQVYLWPDKSIEQALAQLPLAERRAAAQEWFTRAREHIRAEAPVKHVRSSRRFPRYHSFECDLPGVALPRLLCQPGI